MILSIFTTLYIILIAQGVQAWWYQPVGYGFGYHHASWYHPYPAFGPMPYYQPHPYHPYHYADIHHMYSAHKGAQIGAALGSLAANLGRKK
ncbi:Uncharacterized protein BM_BM10190 [Brugia malayi]|uniref:Bm10190 n=1 Tax=Brugia malayi TaxID=6279 RepID=A0A0K0IMC7_BRUMA|nr:Uncharacterized protein BM_BM10190 [Brugia malayi]CDQ03823.1 Bm10190 [Brugia malayi]VIO95266.1 Uncharacterized protein BM_BM10190 [Brugia malayi]